MAIAPASAQQQPNPERNAYFGETHIHTSWSFDAYVFGNMKAGPEDAYKFAMGQPIEHPAGYEIKITRPLDFMAVTDHAEYVGTVPLANDPNSDISKLPIAEKLKVRSKEDIMKRVRVSRRFNYQEPANPGANDPRGGGSASGSRLSLLRTSITSRESSRPSRPMSGLRRQTIATCTATSSSRTPRRCRNIPFTSMDSDHPEDLWKWMDAQRKAGNELLAISHNANLSDGIMFPLEVDSKNRPIDAAWAQERVNNEPLTEIHQLKGTSETTPVLSPNDEFADYELLNYLLGGVERTPKIHGSYIREAWQNGLAMQDSRGYNPYKMGVVGASDSHNTAAGYSQSDYFGGHGLAGRHASEAFERQERGGPEYGFAQHCRSGRCVGGRKYA